MGFMLDPYAIFLVRWFHILSGVMWIGLLWYFNFVQTPGMPKIPDEQKPAITKVIAPSALFWFRWGALSTIVWGLVQSWQLGFIKGALSLGTMSHSPKDMMIGFGMWMGLIMAFNVWFIIWPAQKKILGGKASAEDLPALERPANAISAPASSGNWSGRCAASTNAAPCRGLSDAFLRPCAWVPASPWPG